jgi:hypothetical protein
MRNLVLGGVAVVGALSLAIPAAPVLAQGSCGFGQRCGGSGPSARAGQFRYQHQGFARNDRQGYARHDRQGYAHNDRHDNGVGLGVAAGAALATGAIIGGALNQGYDQGYYQDSVPDDTYVYSDPGPSYVYSDPAPVYDAAPQVADEGDSVAYCQRTYRSYDPASGTYLGYDGLRHPCP